MAGRVEEEHPQLGGGEAELAHQHPPGALEAALVDDRRHLVEWQRLRCLVSHTAQHATDRSVLVLVIHRPTCPAVTPRPAAAKVSMLEPHRVRSWRWAHTVDLPDETRRTRIDKTTP